MLNMNLKQKGDARENSDFKTNYPIIYTMKSK